MKNVIQSARYLEELSIVWGDYNNMCGPLLMNSNLVISGIVYP